jgi:hypothetical protein
MKISKWLVGAIFLGSFTNNSFTQSHNFNWSQPLGSAANEHGRAIAADNSGNVISTGYFRNTIDFDSGTGVFNLTSNSGTADGFIKKTDANGDFIWAVSIGGTPNDLVIQAVTTNTAGDIYLTGYFSGTMDADPSGTGTTILTSQGSSDFFVVKLDANSNLLWAHSFGSPGSETGNSIAVDDAGNVYVAGFLSGTVDLDPGTAVENFTSNGAADAYLLKLDTDGNYVGAWTFGSTANDDAYGVDVDASGNMFLSGYVNGTVDFDPGTGTQNLTSSGAADFFLVKLNSTGAYEWAFLVGDSGEEIALDIQLDTAENILMTGRFAGTVDFDPGSGTSERTAVGGFDVFVAKYDTDGNYVWANGIGGVQNDEGWGVTVDDMNNVYATGFYRVTADFDPSAGTADIPVNGFADAFVVQYNSNGAYEWAYNIGGTVDDHGYDIYCDVNNAINVIGYYGTTVDFDPTTGTSNSTAVGGSDIFQFNWKNCADYEVEVISACDEYTWIDGITYTSSNNTATDTLSNQNGCDSIVTLDLTIIQIDNGITNSDPSLSADMNGATYQWLDCGDNFAPLTGETSQLFTAVANGDYAVEVSMGGCVDTSICQTVATVGLNDLSSESVNIFPNPTEGNIWVEIPSFNTSAIIRVLSLDGKEQLAQVLNSNKEMISLNGLSNGTYIVEIISKEQIFINKVRLF